MKRYKKDKRPDEETIQFIEGFMDFSRMMFAMSPGQNDLITSTGIKMAKDLGNSEDCRSRKEFDALNAKYIDLLKNWIGHGWIKNPENKQMDMLSQLMALGGIKNPNLDVKNNPTRNLDPKPIRDPNRYPQPIYYSNPDHSCPKCGWKPPKKIKNPPRFCWQCLWSPIFINNIWIDIYTLLDPDNIYNDILTKNNSKQTQSINSKQHKYFSKFSNLKKTEGCLSIIEGWKKVVNEWESNKNLQKINPFDSLYAAFQALKIQSNDILLWKKFAEIAYVVQIPEITYRAEQILLIFEPGNQMLRRHFNQSFMDNSAIPTLFLRNAIANFDKKGYYLITLSYLRTAFLTENDDLLQLNWITGWFLFHWNLFHESRPFYEKALTISSNRPDANSLYFSCHLKLTFIEILSDNIDQAEAHLNKARIIFPTDNIVRNWTHNIKLIREGLFDGNEQNIQDIVQQHKAENYQDLRLKKFGNIRPSSFLDSLKNVPDTTQ
ncbi:MAG: tetratricopeptide repeat protein [Promethearchaeota archaeon]